MPNPKSKIQNPKSRATFEFVSGSPEDTQALGEQIGRVLRAGDVVALHGELGSGKTTLIQGIARGLGLDPERIKSPTFVLMREYRGLTAVVHIDGYRLEGAPAAAALDLELAWSPQKVTLIEWAERFADLLPEERLEIRMTHVSTNRRRIMVTAAGPRGEEMLKALPAPGPAAETTNAPAGD